MYMYMYYLILLIFISKGFVILKLVKINVSTFHSHLDTIFKKKKRTCYCDSEMSFNFIVDFYLLGILAFINYLNLLINNYQKYCQISS